ncbi:MAG: Lrp/AsnC family transcriptional regulator [Acidobacteria bacterium]|nr:Lrp/AsnC family transcriptional regulator [Acidobacteriota bacterium]MCW5970473.1 Lrp/AsnC family transcriptional regulator [Blastocatellales bacterium]
MGLDSEKLLDDIGWRILTELQQNARLTYAELGRRVRLSIPAVTERVRKMEDAGIIRGYGTDLDLAKIGLPVTAFIRLSLIGDVSPRLIELFKETPEIVSCHRVTGADSFIFEAHLASVAHLEMLIDKFVPFGTTTTTIVLSTVVARRTIDKREHGTRGK